MDVAGGTRSSKGEPGNKKGHDEEFEYDDEYYDDEDAGDATATQAAAPGKEGAKYNS